MDAGLGRLLSFFSEDGDSGDTDDNAVDAQSEVKGLWKAVQSGKLERVR